MIPGNAPVTVENYLTHEIIIDCESAYDIIHKNDQRWHRDGLKNYIVYRLEAGKVHGDIIVSVLED